MGKKRIMFFYPADKHNQMIAEADYKKSLTYIREIAGPFSNLIIDDYSASSIQQLQGKIANLLLDSVDEELFFHFSGHGLLEGLPYSDRLLKNNDLAALLDHPKIRCCFFSSCSSAELANITNQRRIPVVIGTLGDNPIGNEFGIEFQKIFYRELIQTSRTFKVAFETAISTLEQEKNKTFQKAVFVRGEGGTKAAPSALNALQIIFSADKDQDLTLLPTNFIHEINNPRPETSYLLTWFDSPIESENFYRSFINKGFSEQLYYIPIPTDQLHLLEEKERLHGAYGMTRPYGFVDKTRLLIGVTSEKQLPVELLTHLAHEEIWKSDHYKVLIAHRNRVAPEALFPDEEYIEQIPESRFIGYKKITELTQSDGFLNELIGHKIEFSRRRRITLQIETIPTRKDVYTPGIDRVKFIRAFLGKTANEKLINYVVNYIRDINSLSYRVILFDNQQDGNLDFLQYLKAEIIEQKPGSTEHSDITNALSGGLIAVLRNRGGDVSIWQQTITSILAWLAQSAVGFQHSPPRPSYIFFLHDASVAAPEFQSNVIYMAEMKDPNPIDEAVLTEWCKGYPEEREGPVVAETLAELIAQIHVENYSMGCPSGVIAEISDRMKVPRAQVINI